MSFLPSLVMLLTTYIHFRLGVRLSLNPEMPIPGSFLIAVSLSLVSILATIAYVGVIPEVILDVEGVGLYSWIAIACGVASLLFARIFIRKTRLHA